MNEDEWVAFIRALDGMVRDVAESVREITRSSARCEGILPEDLSGGIRTAVREEAHSVQLHARDIVDRLVAYGHELDRMRQGREL